MVMTEILMAWIQNTTEIKRKLSKYVKTDRSPVKYFHINLWMRKTPLIFGSSLLVTCIKISHISGFGMLVWMTNKEFRKYCDISKLNSTIEEWIFPLILMIFAMHSLKPLKSAKLKLKLSHGLQHFQCPIHPSLFKLNATSILLV